MRIESAVTSLSWIPSEAVEGATRLPFEIGVGHYDDPPPDTIGDLDQLRAAGAFRFANDLRAWVEVRDGKIVDHGHTGRGFISSTLLRVGPLRVSFQATAFPDLRSVSEVTDTYVRLEQTTGGRPGVPAPRLVEGKPFVQVLGPTVWTTLRLPIRSDGSSEGELVGASPFPRHWVYDRERRLVAKSGLTDFRHWYATAFGTHSPWGDYDSPVLVTTVETALERQLSTAIMRGGATPAMKVLKAGDVLARQGQPGEDLYLLLDGVLQVEVDDERIGEVGPGAVIGERAILEGGHRTATVRALTGCKVAVAPADQIDHAALAELSAGHRREDGTPP